MSNKNIAGVVIWIATLAVMTNISGMNSFRFLNIPSLLWVGLGLAGAMLFTNSPQQSRIERLNIAAQAAWMSGIISFIISLIIVLSNLDEPASIGPNLAVALISVLYGSIIRFFCQTLAMRHEKATE